MSEDLAQKSNLPLLNFNSPKAPPTILVLGSLVLRGIAWWEDIDFILSIREEKIAMTLQLFLDWGWLILAVVGIVLWLGAHRAPPDPTEVHWGMVASVGILAFIAGALITVHAIGSTPTVLNQWGGDPVAKTCNAIVDTSRLVGYKDRDRIILLCGVSDPTQDPIEDQRIAVSQPFTITGQATIIVAPYGAMESAVDQAAATAKATGQVPPPNQNLGFNLWHSVALVPRDLNVSEIKRVSDVAKRGGKILTEPQAGAHGSAQAIILIPAPAIAPQTSAPKKNKS